MRRAPKGPEASVAVRAPRRIALVAGWLAAAAATIVATKLWFTDRPPAVAPRPAWSELSASADDVATSSWVGGRETLALTGHVFWSGRRQRGYLQVRGLPVNQPSITRYQLWIFDRDRDPRYPVDGGMFDAAPSGETIVEVAPRIPIVAATQFMITAEAPTGTVVSDRSRVIATAQVR